MCHLAEHTCRLLLCLNLLRELGIIVNPNCTLGNYLIPIDALCYSKWQISYSKWQIRDSKWQISILRHFHLRHPQNKFISTVSSYPYIVRKLKAPDYTKRGHLVFNEDIKGNNVTYSIFRHRLWGLNDLKMNLIFCIQLYNTRCWFFLLWSNFWYHDFF